MTVEIFPQINGHPTVEDVAQVFMQIGDPASAHDEVLRRWPQVTESQIDAALLMAARAVREQGERSTRMADEFDALADEAKEMRDGDGPPDAA